MTSFHKFKSFIPKMSKKWTINHQTKLAKLFADGDLTDADSPKIGKAADPIFKDITPKSFGYYFNKIKKDGEYLIKS